MNGFYRMLGRTSHRIKDRRMRTARDGFCDTGWLSDHGLLVLEMSLVSDDDGDGTGVGQVESGFVFQRPAGVDNCGHAGIEK